MEEPAPAPPPQQPRLGRRSLQLVLAATLVALVPLALRARSTTARAQDAVRDEVAARLRVTTAMSASLLAEQLGSFVTLAEAEARRPRLRPAVADGQPRAAGRHPSARAARPPPARHRRRGGPAAPEDGPPYSRPAGGSDQRRRHPRAHRAAAGRRRGRVLTKPLDIGRLLQVVEGLLAATQR